MHSITKGFQLLGNKWGSNQTTGTSGGTVTYSFASQNFENQFAPFDAFIAKDVAKSDIATSLEAWETIADIRFVEVPDAEGVDIRFGWGDFDGEGAILGETTIPAEGPLGDVVVLLDISEDWFFQGMSETSKIDFQATVTHEIGHAIGIDHSENTQALMNPFYSESTLELKRDDIEAVTAIYGSNPEIKVEIFRFFNPDVGGHFFTESILEKQVVEGNGHHLAEGVGFIALGDGQIMPDDSVPVYRFLNTSVNSHLFTAFENEKEHLLAQPSFSFEGVAFYAYGSKSTSTDPVYRFFDVEKGGHFFTVSETERDHVLNLEQFRYEGEAFYAFADLNL